MFISTGKYFNSTNAFTKTYISLELSTVDYHPYNNYIIMFADRSINNKYIIYFISVGKRTLF